MSDPAARLLDNQTACVQEIREAFYYATGDQYGVPEVLQAIIWSYANPGLYQPSNDDLEEEEDDIDSDEESDKSSFESHAEINFRLAYESDENDLESDS